MINGVIECRNILSLLKNVTPVGVCTCGTVAHVAQWGQEGHAGCTVTQHSLLLRLHAKEILYRFSYAGIMVLQLVRILN